MVGVTPLSRRQHSTRQSNYLIRPRALDPGPCICLHDHANEAECRQVVVALNCSRAYVLRSLPTDFALASLAHSTFLGRLGRRHLTRPRSSRSFAPKHEALRVDLSDFAFPVFARPATTQTLFASNLIMLRRQPSTEALLSAESGSAQPASYGSASANYTDQERWKDTESTPSSAGDGVRDVEAIVSVWSKWLLIFAYASVYLGSF